VFCFENENQFQSPPAVSFKNAKANLCEKGTTSPSKILNKNMIMSKSFFLFEKKRNSKKEIVTKAHLQKHSYFFFLFELTLSPRRSNRKKRFSPVFSPVPHINKKQDALQTFPNGNEQLDDLMSDVRKSIHFADEDDFLKKDPSILRTESEI
jgi:hypothetical protein